MLKIILDDDETLHLEVYDTSGIVPAFNRDRTADLLKIADFYKQLSVATFQKRISPLLASIKEKGEFSFGGCRFVPPDGIIYKDQTFARNQTNFLRHYTFIEVQKKDANFREKVMRHVPFTNSARFATDWDSDVIFALLDRFFGLRWK